MKLLCVTSVFPVPADRGTPLRILGLLHALRARHDIHVLAVERTSTTEDLRQKLAEILRSPVEMFPRDEESHTSRRGLFRKWARALSMRTPPWILESVSARVGERLKDIVADFDAVVVLDDHAAIYTPMCRVVPRPVIQDKHNVLGASFASEKPAGMAWWHWIRYFLGLILTRSFERRTLRHATSISVTSEEETRRLRRLYGRGSEAIPSAIDIGSRAKPAEGSRVIGWLGSLDYLPNLHGLERFVADGWPALAEQGYELHVAGSGDSGRVSQRFGSTDGVRVLGWVEDLDSFLNRLGAAVIPLWSGGGGVRLKSLTLMSSSIPLAVTPLAVEGIPVEDGVHCYVRQDPPSLADALRALLEDPRRAEAMGEAARTLVQRDFSWDVVGPRFVRLVEQAAGAAR